MREIKLPPTRIKEKLANRTLYLDTEKVSWKHYDEYTCQIYDDAKRTHLVETLSWREYIRE